MKVLGIIPARGGSKGIPRKNTRMLGGKAVIEWTIESALSSKLITNLIVTTDDPEIADVARKAGAHLPFLRPAELAGDQVPTLPVLQHALQHMPGFDAVCLLQPTTPFRETGEIDLCISTLLESGADSVVTMARIPDEHHPEWAYIENCDGFMHLHSESPDPPTRRQSLRPTYFRDGSVYVARTKFIEANTLYGERIKGVIVSRSQHVNLDTLDDWHLAKTIANKILRQNFDDTDTKTGSVVLG